MIRRLTAASLALAVAALSLTLTGCSGASSRCFPEPLKATQTSTSAGGSVTVSSAAASCDLGYSADHTYSLILANKGVISKAVRALVGKDGSFSAELMVPADFPQGETYVLVKGSTYDNCKDTGSCVGYAVSITVK